MIDYLLAVAREHWDWQHSTVVIACLFDRLFILGKCRRMAVLHLLFAVVFCGIIFTRATTPSAALVDEDTVRIHMMMTMAECSRMCELAAIVSMFDYLLFFGVLGLLERRRARSSKHGE